MEQKPYDSGNQSNSGGKQTLPFNYAMIVPRNSMSIISLQIADIRQLKIIFGPRPHSRLFIENIIFRHIDYISSFF